VDLQQQLSSEYSAIPKYRAGLASFLNKLGALCLEARRHDRAEEAFNKSRTEYKSLADDYPQVAAYQEGLVTVLFNLSLLYKRVPRPDDAERALRDAVTAAEKLRHDFPEHERTPVLAECCCQLGWLFAYRGRLEEALPWFERAVEATRPPAHRDG